MYLRSTIEFTSIHHPTETFSASGRRLLPRFRELHRQSFTPGEDQPQGRRFGHGTSGKFSDAKHHENIICLMEMWGFDRHSWGL